MFLIGFAITVFGLWFFVIILGGDDSILVDIPSFLIIVVPLLGVLTATQSFKVFYAGLRAVIFPKEEITEDMRGRAATLFRLLSKVAVMAGGMGTLISLVNMLMNLNFSESIFTAHMGYVVAFALITLLYGLLFAAIVFEPVVFILKKRSAKQR